MQTFRGSVHIMLLMNIENAGSHDQFPLNLRQIRLVSGLKMFVIIIYNMFVVNYCSTIKNFIHTLCVLLLTSICIHPSLFHRFHLHSISRLRISAYFFNIKIYIKKYIYIKIIAKPN